MVIRATALQSALAGMTTAHAQVESAAQSLAKPLFASPSELFSAAAQDDSPSGALATASMSADMGSSLIALNESLTLARCLIAQGEAGQAIVLLARVRQAAEGAQRMRSVVESTVLQALAFQARGDAEQARAALERALCLAEPEGYLRTFLDEGVPVVALLRETRLSRDVTPGYVQSLLAAGVHPPTPRAQPLVEPLSPREVEVLQLIAAGSSNRSIRAKGLPAGIAN